MLREFTNLNWPDGPYGAEFRPFGTPSRVLTALALDWAGTGSEPIPMCAAVIYLRVKPAQTLLVDEYSLSFGFRTTVIEAVQDVDAQLDVVDRCLVGARRHATILAGHRLDEDLTRLGRLTARRLPGVAGVGEAWADRAVKGRGLARMVDTSRDLDGPPPALDVPLDPDPLAMPAAAAEIAQAAQRALARGLAIGLSAAVHDGRMTWADTFHTLTAVGHTAWDIFDIQARQPRSG